MRLLADLLRRQALPTGRPDRPALVLGDDVWTYRRLDETTDRIAAVLVTLGVQPGDRVALLDRNCPFWVAVYFAVARIGAILVPLNFWHRAGELGYVLDDSGAAVAIASGDFASVLEACRPTAASVRHWLWYARPAVPPSEDLERLVASQTGVPPAVAVAEEAPHIILYTSGTTGRPKGVVLSHRAHLEQARMFALKLRFAEDDVWLNAYPLFHTGGMDCGVLPAFVVGATVVLLRHPDAESILASVERHRVTAFMVVPTLWRRICALAEQGNYQTGSLERMAGSSDAMPRDVLEKVTALFGAPYVQTYGLTEAGCILTYLDPADAVRKLGSAGRPHSACELRLEDREGQPVPAGQVGEIVARTEHAMLGYWGMAEETERTLRDNWLRTGDLGRLDDEGYLWIVGRAKDLIISGGENIDPAEVERCLCQHPAVAEAAAIGVPDADWGERVLAVVVLSAGSAATANELIEFVRPRLAGYKRPARVEFVAELPRTASTGKVQKAILRQRFG